jgi:DNA (cytosine-5)-methyltransferase 1
MKDPKTILTDAYEKAIKVASAASFDSFEPIEIRNDIDSFITKIETDKSLVQVIITTILKKIVSPEQDIRFHMAKLEGGYSARVLDTQVTTPFFKNNFPKYANKETAFLTKATRAEIVWTFEDGQRLPFRSKTLVEPFLRLVDSIQHNTIDLDNWLVYIFAKLITLTDKNQSVFDDTIETADFSDVLNINTVIGMLHQHFQAKLSSRLPVIAIFAAYKQLFKNVKRYDKKNLRPLNVHTSSDKHGYGDIEIWNNDNTPFEMIEVKHNIAIDRNLIFDVVKKSENTTIKRYYILTTYSGSFLNAEEEEFINKFMLKVKKQRDIEVIANGILNTLKYYLRFIEDYHEFLKTYTEELVNDAQNSTEVKAFHLQIWQDILKSYKRNDPSV